MTTTPKFKPMVPDKKFDMEGTPLPPSHPKSIFTIDTSVLRVDWANLGWKKQQDIKSKIVGTRLRKWRSAQIRSNRLIYHTKRNGVGFHQGWCECLDEGTAPCKIIRDLLEITPQEFEYCKANEN